MIKSKNKKTVKKYSMYDYFDKDDIIDHTVFGIGMVLSKFDSKIEVAFITKTDDHSMHYRTLVHNRETNNMEELCHKKQK